MSTKTTALGSKKPKLSLFSRSEITTFIIMVVILVTLLIVTENFRDIAYLVKSATRNVEFGLVALIITFVIISGMIDLSVASAMALCATVTGLFFRDAGLPLGVAILFGLVTGLCCGLINGVLVAYTKIQPMIITIATLSLFRGISQIFIGDHSIGKFPDWFNSLDKRYLCSIGDVNIAYTLIFMILVAAGMQITLQYTPLGRKIYALGTKENVAEFSGINVKKIKLWLFGISGVVAAVAGILMMSRLQVVRYDMANGGELDVITIVLLGGTSIDGGRGTILGTFLGWLTVVFLRSGLSVAGVTADQQMFAMGALLVVSIVIPQITNAIQARKQ